MVSSKEEMLFIIFVSELLKINYNAQNTSKKKTLKMFNY